MVLVGRTTSPLAAEIRRTTHPVHQVVVQGAPILCIYRLDGDQGTDAYRRWLAECDHNVARGRVRSHLNAHPELYREFLRSYRTRDARALESLRPRFPEELQPDLTVLLEGPPDDLLAEQ